MGLGCRAGHGVRWEAERVDPGAADEDDLPAALDAGDGRVDKLEGDGDALSVAGPVLGVCVE